MLSCRLKKLFRRGECDFWREDLSFPVADRRAASNLAFFSWFCQLVTDGGASSCDGEMDCSRDVRFLANSRSQVSYVLRMYRTARNASSPIRVLWCRIASYTVEAMVVAVDSIFQFVRTNDCPAIPSYDLAWKI